MLRRLLQRKINGFVNKHAIRDESEPNKPFLPIWDQPLIIRVLVKSKLY